MDRLPRELVRSIGLYMSNSDTAQMAVVSKRQNSDLSDDLIVRREK